MLALGSEGKHGLAGDTAVIKLHNLEDSLRWTVAYFPGLNNLPVLCFSSLGLLCESHLGIFSKCHTFFLVLHLGCGRMECLMLSTDHLPVFLLVALFWSSPGLPALI